MSKKTDEDMPLNSISVDGDETLFVFDKDISTLAVENCKSISDDLSHGTEKEGFFLTNTGKIATYSEDLAFCLEAESGISFRSVDLKREQVWYLFSFPILIFI